MVEKNEYLPDNMLPDHEVLLHHWEQLAGSSDGDIPKKTEFDPLDLPTSMGDLIWIAIEREPELRFKFILYGTRVTNLRGRNLTGHYVDESINPHIRDITLESYTWAMENRAPRYDFMPWQPTYKNTADYHRLVMPFRGGEERCDFLLSSFLATGKESGEVIR